jgi:UrcA family protein
MRMQSLALALAVAVAAPATAADEAPRVAVRYADLDLSTTQGQRELDRRLQKAAREVCGTQEKITGSRLGSEHSRECYREVRRLGALPVSDRPSP